MPERDLLIILDDILEAINLIEQYTNTLSIGEFQKDTKTRDATLRNLVKHVSWSLRQSKTGITRFHGGK